jgi:hypothetical protein
MAKNLCLKLDNDSRHSPAARTMHNYLYPILCPISITDTSKWAQCGRGRFAFPGFENQREIKASHSIANFSRRSLNQRVAGAVSATHDTDAIFRFSRQISLLRHWPGAEPYSSLRSIALRSLPFYRCYR